MLTLEALKEYGADTEDGLKRCMDNRDFYIRLIGKALENKCFKELEKQGIKPIWACDKANVESDRLAQRLGYVNPLEYEFVYLEPPK